MPRYLITGGCGFIGTKLVKTLLDAGNEVTVLDDLSVGKRESIPENVPLIEADVADLSAVREAITNMDGCFHLAADPSVARSIEDYPGSHRVNLGGTIAVLDGASWEAKRRQVPVPVVYASSCAVYGKPTYLPSVEATAASPMSSYGADKLCGEIHAQMASSAYGVPSVGLRFFNVFGPGQMPDSAYSGVLSIFCRKILAGEQVTIFGDGGQLRDFVFIGDVVEHICRAMERVLEISPGVFNVCRGQGITLLDVGREIASLCDTSFEPVFDSARVGDIRISVGDPAKGNAALGLAATTSLRDGLIQTLDWMKA